MDSYKTLPVKFQKSYLEQSAYPRNIMQRSVSTYPSALDWYATRLKNAAGDLCQTDEAQVEVAIRDLQLDNGSGEDMDKINVRDNKGFAKWIGIKIVRDPFDPLNPAVAIRHRDPKCRFIYIWGQHSRARLQITCALLVEIFTFHQVMPEYLDFVTVFGQQSEPQDLRFSSFREQKTLKSSYSSTGIDNLGRSGRHYQLCYNLKGVTLKQDLEDAANNSWSIRQAAFYHKFDIVGGNTLWIVTKGGNDIQQRFKELTGSNARPEDKAFGTPEECFRSSLSANLLYCYWSSEDWRGYIKWLENTIRDKTELAILGPTGRGHHHHIYTARDIQVLQQWAEKVRDVIIALKSNVDVMTSLRRFYTELKANDEFPMNKTCSDDINVFSSQVSNLIDNFKLQIDRADALVRMTADRTELVKQHRLERLNLNMENEAIIVRIITIVTLVYLPATFVSTFFSTDVVKYQGHEEGASFSSLAMLRWVQVALPLTVVTGALAWWGKTMAERNEKRGVVLGGTGGMQGQRWFPRGWKLRKRKRPDLSVESKV